MSLDEKSAPLSCRNSDIPKGKINKMAEFFNQQALKARAEREIKIQSFHKRKNSSGNNSKEKTNKKEDIQRSPSGKNLLLMMGSNEKKDHLAITQPQFANVDVTENSEMNISNQPHEDFSNETSRRYTLPVNQMKSSCYTVIFKDDNEVAPEVTKPAKEPIKLQNKRKLELQIETTYNDEDEKSLIKTKIDTIKDSLKKYTPKSHNFVIKYNENNKNYDIVPLSYHEFSIIGREVNQRTNFMHSVNQEIYFELLKDFSKYSQNSIETQSDVRKEIEKSPLFSDISTIENHVFELDNSKILNEKVLRKWKNENEISKQYNDIFLRENYEKFLKVQQRNIDLSIIVKAKESYLSYSSIRIEFPSNQKKNLISHIKESEFMIPCEMKADLNLEFVKNEELCYNRIEKACNCLIKWRRDLNIEIVENISLKQKKRESFVSDNEKFQIIAQERQYIQSVNQSSSFDILCKKIQILNHVNTNQFTYEGYVKITDLEESLNENISNIKTNSLKIHEISKKENEIHNQENINIYGSQIKQQENKDIIILQEKRAEDFLINKIKKEENSIHKIECYIPSKVNSNLKKEDCNLKKTKVEEVTFLYQKCPLKLEVTNEINYEFNISVRSVNEYRIGSSSKDSGSTSPEKTKQLIINEVHQFDMKGDEKESILLMQETTNSLFFKREDRPKMKLLVEQMTIYCKHEEDIRDICMSSTLEICKSRKKYIFIEEEKSDIWRSLKISIYTMIFLIILFGMIASIFTHINIKDNFSKNYFKNQSLFKWEIIYSGN